MGGDMGENSESVIIQSLGKVVFRELPIWL